MEECAISCIIPCYNDQVVLNKHLPVLKEYLDHLRISYEIIVVDDGSQDQEAIKGVAARWDVKLLSNPRNLGKGAAVRRGMLNAAGKYRFFTDADVPFELEAFDRSLRYLDAKECDIVVGDRTLPGASYFLKISPSRSIGSHVFAFLAGRFVAGGVFDTQCGFKGFRDSAAKDIFKHCQVNGFAFDVEVLYIALKLNYGIKRLPVSLRSNEGKSVNMLVHGPGMLWDLLRIKYYQVRGRYR